MDTRKVIDALKENGILFEEGLSEQDSVCIHFTAIYSTKRRPIPSASDAIRENAYLRK